MTAINRFDEGSLGPNLLLYYNPTDEAPTTDGSNNITLMPPGYTGKGPDITPDSPLGNVTYLAGNDKVGEANAWVTNNDTVSGLLASLGSQVTFSAGMTVVVVYEDSGVSPASMYAYDVRDAGGSRLAIRSQSGSIRQIYSTGVTFPAEEDPGYHPTTYNTPVTHINVMPDDTGGVKRDVTRYITDAVTGSTTWNKGSTNTVADVADEVRIGGYGTAGLGGKIALFALYDRAVTAQEVTDLQELCQYWIDFGEEPTDTVTPPGPGVPRGGFEKYALINNLVLYYNPGDEAPTTDGVNVTSFPPGYEGSGPTITPDSPAGNVTYDGTTKIGAALSWSIGNTAPVSGMLADLGGQQSYPDGMTIVTVIEPSDPSMYTYDVRAQGASRLAIRSNAVPRAHFNLYSTGQAGPTSGDPGYHLTTYDEPVVHINVMPAFDPESGGAKRDVVRYIWDSVTGTTTWQKGSLNTVADIADEVRIGGYADVGGLGGKMAIFALYDRAVTTEEIAYLFDLCRHWISDGADLPDTPVGTSTSFGPVLPNDLSATLHWEVYMDNNQAAGWQAYTVLSNASLRTDSTGQPDMPAGFNNVLDINSATTADSCQVRCRATTAYTDDVGIITPIAGETKLFVQEAGS